MRYALGAAWVLACLVLATGFAHIGVPLVPAAAAETQTASLNERAAAPDARASPQQNMSTLPKTAQMRCPAGQLVFLSTACGCNGACCACSQGARYLNHCTCRCEQAPPPRPPAASGSASAASSRSEHCQRTWEGAELLAARLRHHAVSLTPTVNSP